VELKLARKNLRWFKLWSAIGWLIIATVIYLSLTPDPIEIDMEQGDKLGHMLAYFVMMIWFSQLYLRRMHAWLASGFIVLGVALEYVQGWSGYRDFEYMDMLADAIGVSLAWAMGCTLMSRLLIDLERLFNK
jgi:VanZ family protein